MDQPTGAFKRSLGLFDSTALVIGSMIGSGVFIVSADIARQTGSPGWLLAVWAIAGVMTIFAALSYGELAGLMPHAGGIYVYLREAYSPMFGFLYGWTLFLVIQCGTIAAVAMAFGKYLGVIFPFISEKTILLNLGFTSINSTELAAILCILFLTWINSRGIEQGKGIQNIFTYLKALILLVFVGIGFYLTNYHPVTFWDTAQLHHGVQTGLSGLALIMAIGTAMVGALFSYDAWYDLTFASGEVKNPGKNIPLSLFLGTLIVTAIYLLVNLMYTFVLPLHGVPEGATIVARGIQFASEDRVATAVMQNLLGHSAELIMAGIVVISTFGCNNGIILSGARVYYAMSKDGLFFKKVGVLNKKGVPSVGLWIQAVWCTVLCLSGSYGQLLDYIVLAVLVFFVLTILAVFIMRKKRPDAERPVRAIGYPVLPAIYIIFCIAIEIIILINKPQYTWPALIILLSGVPVYYIWRKFGSRE